MKKFNNSIYIILILFAGLIVLTATIFVFYGFSLVIQMLNNDTENSATLIGGVLGLLGGIIGALGAYLASSNQIKKQFEKQDKDRVLEIRIKKYDEILNILNNLSNEIGIIFDTADASKKNISSLYNMLNFAGIDSLKNNYPELHLFTESEKNAIEDASKSIESQLYTLNKYGLYFNGIYKDKGETVYSHIPKIVKKPASEFTMIKSDRIDYNLNVQGQFNTSIQALTKFQGNTQISLFDLEEIIKRFESEIEKLIFDDDSFV